MSQIEDPSMKKINQLKKELSDINVIWNKIPATSHNDDSAKKLERMNLLHRYNDVKDAAQIIIGVLANLDQTTVRDMHKKFNLPTD